MPLGQRMKLNGSFSLLPKYSLNLCILFLYELCFPFGLKWRARQKMAKKIRAVIIFHLRLPQRPLPSPVSRHLHDIRTRGTMDFLFLSRLLILYYCYAHRWSIIHTSHPVPRHTTFVYFKALIHIQGQQQLEYLVLEFNQSWVLKARLQ